jgi:hypothetical protein
MTFAWYGPLKDRDVPLWHAILVSWCIAVVEYCFAVPANRIGVGRFTVTQLKVIQEAITLSVFSVFSIVYLRESFRWNYAVGFGFHRARRRRHLSQVDVGLVRSACRQNHGDSPELPVGGLVRASATKFALSCSLVAGVRCRSA